jgi:hypothetical protein
MFRGVSVQEAIQAREEYTPEGTGMREKSQTLFVRNVRFLENPWLRKNDKAVVPYRSQAPHELIRTRVSPGSLRVEERSGEKSNALVRFLMT